MARPKLYTEAEALQRRRYFGLKLKRERHRRGICLTCPNAVEGKYWSCWDCRLKIAAKQKARYYAKKARQQAMKEAA